jgi:hypothetical protein
MREEVEREEQKKMAENHNENRISNLEKNYGDLRVIKRAHAYAMERKKKVRIIVGIISAALSVLVTSGLIELFFPGLGSQASREALVIIKIVTFIAAVLTTALTLLNYEKESSIHQSALGVYANLSRGCGVILAQLKDGSVDQAAIDSKIEAINAEYTKANETFNASPPSNRDYARARRDVAEPKQP